MNEQNAGTEGATTASKERGSGVAAKSHQAAEQLKSAAVDQAERVRRGADSAREQTAERFRRVASHLHSVGDTLRSDDEMASMLAERASRGIASVADYVSSTDVKDFVRDTERLARRQPALFFGGAFMLGLALGRFLKSSGSQQASEGWAREEREPVRYEGERQPWREPRTPNRDFDRQTNQQRFQENYDATFGRDIPTSASERGTSATSAGPSSPKQATTTARNGERSPESNGGRRTGGGKTS